jgi:ribosome-binding factor A
LDFGFDLSFGFWILDFYYFMSYRIAQINELIKRNIAEIIVREMDIKPGVFLTVTRVDTARDLRYTRIFVSVFPESEKGYILRSLEKELYGLQGKLNKKLSLKILPRIEFFEDDTESQADEVEKILKDISN